MIFCGVHMTIEFDDFTFREVEVKLILQYGHLWLFIRRLFVDLGFVVAP